MAKDQVASDQPMKILALDQATNCSGWSLFEDNELIQYGKFSFDDDNIYNRITKVGQKIITLSQQYDPDKIIFEDIQLQQQVGNNAATFQKLAQLQGVLIFVCIYILQKPFDIISPNKWRSICNFLKGNEKNRQAQKKIAQEWVKNKFNKSCTQDEADAICIGYAASFEINNELNWE